VTRRSPAPKYLAVGAQARGTNLNVCDATVRYVNKREAIQAAVEAINFWGGVMTQLFFESDLRLAIYSGFNSWSGRG